MGPSFLLGHHLVISMAGQSLVPTGPSRLSVHLRNVEGSQRLGPQCPALTLSLTHAPLLSLSCLLGQQRTSQGCQSIRLPSKCGQPTSSDATFRLISMGLPSAPHQGEPSCSVPHTAAWTLPVPDSSEWLPGDSATQYLQQREDPPAPFPPDFFPLDPFQLDACT